MKKYLIYFLVFLFAIGFGVSAFSGWRLFQYSKRYASVESKTEVNAPNMETVPVELSPIVAKYNFIAFSVVDGGGIRSLEEADAKNYAPLRGEIVFLQAKSVTEDSSDIKPRYILRVEEYSSSQLAQKRAAEYITEGSNKRIAEACNCNMDEHIVSKFSIRMFGITRGRKFYGLTTEVSLLTYIKLSEDIEKDILKLPEFN